MMQVHMNAPIHLIRATLPIMLHQNRGVIINLSSLGSFLPAANACMYVATKSFIRAFTESLDLELRGTNVIVQALCPGFTKTEYHEVGELENFDRSTIPNMMWSNSIDVVKESLKNCKKDHPVFIPGRKNRFLKHLMQAPIFGRIARNQTIKKKNT
jgi:short-subunit dehydrogenase